jgi:hypothetical protein
MTMASAGLLTHGVAASPRAEDQAAWQAAAKAWRAQYDRLQREDAVEFGRANQGGAANE